MKTYTIKHSLRKSLPTGALYNNQVASIIFCVGIAFKLSLSPGIVARELGSSTLWMYLAYSLLDIVCVVELLLFARKSGDRLLLAQNSIFYRLICGVIAIFLTTKAIFFFGYAASYLTRELFTGTEPYLVYALFLLPVIYLGMKGTKTIGRCCELFSIIFFVAILFNLLFLNTNMDLGRNFPVFSSTPSAVIKKSLKYGLWLNDLLPIVFLRIENKKMPYITTSIATTWTLINLVVMLGVAIYGDALKIVSNLLIHIASFNQLTLEIGRMEWTILFAMLIMSIFSLSFLYNGAMTACKRAVRTDLPCKIAFPITLILLAIFIPTTKTITDFSIGWFGYVMFALSLAIPSILLGNFYVAKCKYRHFYNCLDDVYAPYKNNSKTYIDSLANGILKGYQQEAKNTQIIMPNGTLQPKGNNNE